MWDLILSIVETSPRETKRACQLRERAAAFAVAAYILLGTAWFVTAWATVGGYADDRFHIASGVVWATLATAFTLRRRWAWVLLVGFEFVSLISWVERPNEWLLFAAQIALLTTLLSPPVERFLHARPQSPKSCIALATNDPGRLRRLPWLLLGVGGCAASAVLALGGESAAIPLLAMSVFWFLIPPRVQATLSDKRDQASSPQVPRELPRE